jgi:hypothetical protein
VRQGIGEAIAGFCGEADSLMAQRQGCGRLAKSLQASSEEGFLTG